jgi:hypothetical protein
MHSEYEKYYGKPKAETCVKDEKWTAGEERSSKKRKRNEVSRTEKWRILIFDEDYEAAEEWYRNEVVEVESTENGVDKPEQRRWYQLDENGSPIWKAELSKKKSTMSDKPELNGVVKSGK